MASAVLSLSKLGGCIVLKLDLSKYLYKCYRAAQLGALQVCIVRGQQLFRVWATRTTLLFSSPNLVCCCCCCCETEGAAAHICQQQHCSIAISSNCQQLQVFLEVSTLVNNDDILALPSCWLALATNNMDGHTGLRLVTF